jgi:hypothetical protein
LVLIFLWPLLLLLPRVLEVWCTDVLTVSNADNRVLSYKQRVHNIPTAPWPLRWLLGMGVSWGLMHGCGW